MEKEQLLIHHLLPFKHIPGCYHPSGKVTFFKISIYRLTWTGYIWLIEQPTSFSTMNIITKVLSLACLLVISTISHAQTMPPANFGWTPDTSCVGQLVTFTDSTVGLLGPKYHAWSFGDGTSSNSWTPQFTVNHTYSIPGTYNVRMCVYDTIFNDTACISQPVIVQNCGSTSPLQANFGLPDTICFPAQTFIQPWDSTSGLTWPFSYSWTLSNGATASTQNPIFYIQTTGTYSLTLCVTDGSGNTSCTTKSVVVAGCNATPLGATFAAPDTICFWDTQTLQVPGGAIGGSGFFFFSWTITNGATLTIRSHATVTFPGPGVYNLTLCVIDSLIGDTACFDKDITVLGGNCGSPLTTTFSWWPNPACVNLPVQFTNSTTGGSSTYQYAWDFGDGTTNTNSAPSHTYATLGTYVVTLCVIDTVLNDTVCTSQTVHVNPPCSSSVNVGSIWASMDTLCSGQFVQFYDSTTGGSSQAGLIYDWNFGDGNSSNKQQPGHSYTNPGNFTVSLCIYDTLSFDTSCASMSIVVLTTCLDTISGYVYHDVNGNLSYDGGDTPLNGQSVAIYPGPTYVFTNTNGFYEMPAAPGSYVVEAPTITGYGNTSPASGNYSHTLSGSGSRYSGDFGYDSLLSQYDLKVYMFCSTPRPGFNTWISSYYRNQGTTPVAATLTLTYDPLLIFTHSQSNGVHNAVNHTVTWTFPNLTPSSISARVRAFFIVPANATLGQLVTSSVTITPLQGDINQANNDDYCTRTVTGSWDPNDKQVRPGEGPEGYIDGDERLTYNVRFQNTGTDTAFTVVLKDKIDPNLDLSTFQMHGSSHQYSLIINKNREAVWTFNNILLPDSNINEPESHGNIQYSIMPQTGLQPGQRIENTAEIYFDFNPAVITNTTVNTIREATAIDGNLIFDGFQVSPNPSKDLVQILFVNPFQVTHKFSLMDAQGKRLQHRTTTDSEIKVDLSSYPQGVYFYRLEAEDGRKLMGRLIKI